jgi:hypothetical protein
MLLSDGTPVWEVRDSDGSVSVVGAALAATADALPGVETMTTWVKPLHRFIGGGVHDEYGKALGYLAPDVGGDPPLPTTARDMTTYPTRIVGQTVQVGEAHPGVIRNFDAHRAVLGAGVFPEDQVVSFDPSSGPLVPVRTIDQALAEPAGTMSLVDADIIFVDGGAGHVCSGGQRVAHIPFPPCPSDSLVLPGVSDPDGKDYVWAIIGPIFFRTDHSTFTETATYGGAESGAAYRINGTVPNPSP